MTPAQMIGMLDRALARNGQTVTLRRIVGTGSSPVNHDVAVRVQVRAMKENELVAGISQDDLMVIMSPTEITQANWPAGTFAVPRKNDKMIVSGAPCNIEFVNLLVRAGALVRIEMRLRG